MIYRADYTTHLQVAGAADRWRPHYGGDTSHLGRSERFVLLNVKFAVTMSDSMRISILKRGFTERD